jgi:hypothetical protein
MLTALDFQEWVRSVAVLHTPAGLDRRRALDKSNLIKNILIPSVFLQALISDDGGERPSSLWP